MIMKRALTLATTAAAGLAMAVAGGCAASGEQQATSTARGAAVLSQPVTVHDSEQFDLTSDQGAVYRVFVALPREEAPADGYGVFYVLDGNSMFLTAVDAARFQHGLTPTIVVGIGYPTEGKGDIDRRYFDLTPVTPEDKIMHSSTEPQVKPGGTGGQDQFLDFIQNKLKPELAHRYGTNANKQTIFGHSLSGRFVLHALFTHPDWFENYIAASPSIWWGDKSILAEADAFIKQYQNKKDAVQRGVLIMVAEYEQRYAPGTAKARAEFLTKARMVDNAREMAQRLEKITSLRVDFAEFAQENHGSVVPFEIGRAVRFSLIPRK